MTRDTRTRGAILAAGCALLVFSVNAYAQTGPIITTVAGGGTSGLGDGGPATAAQLSYPAGAVADGGGNLYIADTFNYRIRRVSAATGVISTVAGTGVGGYSGDGGLATEAQLTRPYGIALDGAGNLYIADLDNHRVRMVSAATGLISTVAGTGTTGYNGDGGAATEAQLNYPNGVAADGAGNIYIADTDNHRIRMVSVATGLISTVAGTGTGGYNGDGVAATLSELNFPYGVALDNAGNLLIADTQNARARLVSLASGVISTLAGTGTTGYNGDGGPATAAQLNIPSGLATDSVGDLYIADSYNHRVRVVSVATGVISTLAGTGAGGYSGDDGPATAAGLNVPNGVAVDGEGNLLIADYSNCRIRQVSRTPGIRSDFDGDLTSDVMWRNIAQGDIWLWSMAGGAKASEAYVRTVADLDWEIRGQGDQDGDGKADFLWRNKATGMIYYWRMDGSTPVDERYVSTVDLAYDIIGTGDFDGDGKSDILWRNAVVGDVWVWRMDGATVLGEGYVDTVGPAYVVKGIGDLDGDTAEDVVWYGTVGDVWAWLMNGTTKKSQAYVGTVGELAFQIQQVADFGGDRKADLLWWNDVSGEVWTWQMDGTSVASKHFVGAVPDTNYRIMAAGDYNGDTRADILWRHATRGELWVWLMNGPVKESEFYLGMVPDTNYQIVK